MEYDYGRSQGQGGYESRPVYGRTSSNNNNASNFAHYPRIGHAAGAPGSPVTRALPPPPPVSNPSFPCKCVEFLNETKKFQHLVKLKVSSSFTTQYWNAFFTLNKIYLHFPLLRSSVGRFCSRSSDQSGR